MKRIAIALICLFAVSTHATTFTVMNTNDTGAGSLRIAISNANANAGSHLIDFAIPGAGVQTINPATQLPALSKSVTIDGYTQAGASANTLTNDDNAILLIELNGTGTGGNGLNINVTNCIIRGLVINRFAVNGIGTDNSRDNLIEGNFIGTDPTGTIKRPNAAGLLIGGQNTVVGGTTPAARNLISGNTGQGLATSGTATTNIMIRGNFIGTDVHGTAALGNGGNGVAASSATKNTIGGTAPGAGNVISGNGGNGVSIVTSNNIVQANFIGTDITGMLNLSNHLDGVALNSARDNTIGGAVGNIIAFNGGAGVSISPTVPNNTNNLISANSIFSNGALGINLVANSDPASGVTSNDVNDVDTGANHLQNFPVLTSATSTVNSVTIAGLLDSIASTPFTLEFFANSVCDPSGFGEGETFIGATNVTTGANHTNVFLVTFPVAVANAMLITATATDPDNNTSEFSKCLTNISTVVTGVPPQITCPANIVTNTTAATCAHSLTFIATATGTPTPVISYKTNTVTVTSPVTFPRGVTTVNCTASNAIGTAQCAFTVTVNDAQLPQPICPGNITSNVDAGVTSSIVDYNLNGTDNCPGVSLAGNPPSGSTFGLGSNTVTVTATDTTGNSNSCTFSVIVLAGQPCTITCPSDIVSNTAPGQCGATVTFNIASSGPCPSAIAVPASGSFFNKGTTPVTVSTNGVTACTFNVTVNDTERPHFITCPGNIVSNVAADATSSVVDFTFSATDNCGLASSNCVPASGTVFALGTTNVTCTVTDTSGNTTNCTFTVTVQAAAPETHDLAVVSIHAPKNVSLKAASPALTKRVKVQIQNLSAHSETIPDLTVLGDLVSVTLSNLHTDCTAPTADLIQGPPNKPKTIKPKGKLNVFFNVSFDPNGCVPDPLKSTKTNPGHEDFSYTAHVNHAALDNNADTVPANDDCPRPPNLATGDKGCGNKDSVTKQLGADVKTDVFVR